MDCMLKLKMSNVYLASAWKSDCSNWNLYLATNLLRLGEMKLDMKQKKLIIVNCDWDPLCVRGN